MIFSAGPGQVHGYPGPSSRSPICDGALRTGDVPLVGPALSRIRTGCTVKILLIPEIIWIK